MELKRELDRRIDENHRLHRELDKAIQQANHDYERCMRIMFPFNGGCDRRSPRVRDLETDIRNNEREIDRLEHALHLR